MAPPKNEWVLTDASSLRRAVDGMRRQRKLSWEDLYHKAKSRVYYAFVKGRTGNLHSDSIFRLVDSLGYEVVIRPNSTSLTQRRMALLAQEKAERDAKQAQADEQAEPVEQDRDEQGRLKVLTPEQTAEAEALLEHYGSY